MVIRAVGPPATASLNPRRTGEGVGFNLTSPPMVFPKIYFLERWWSPAFF